MSTTFPGTTIEVLKLQEGSSKTLFDGIFAAGGITLSQVSVMTGLEPYVIQNWVKRGFVSPPIKRLYSRDQFARIVIINMLRESLQLEHICGLIKEIGGELDDISDDLISDSDLYHRYVDMLADEALVFVDGASVSAVAENAAKDFVENIPNSTRRLVRILQVMLYAHAASSFRRRAEDIFATLR